MAYWLLIYTGTRRGELLGLEWRDVDLEAGTLTIRQQYTLEANKPVLKEPKTDQSRRTIDLDPDTIALLHEHREAHLQQRVAAGGAWVERAHDFVVCKPTAARSILNGCAIGSSARSHTAAFGGSRSMDASGALLGQLPVGLPGRMGGDVQLHPEALAIVKGITP